VFLHVWAAACLTFTIIAGVILILTFLQIMILISNHFETDDFYFYLKSLFDCVILILIHFICDLFQSWSWSMTSFGKDHK